MSEPLETYLRRKYSISQDEYETLLISQGGGCAICKQTNPAKGDQEPERLAVGGWPLTIAIIPERPGRYLASGATNF